MSPESRNSALIVLALMLVFLGVNRTSYKGYFEPDDLDNIGWTQQADALTFAEGIAAPKFYQQNFRPMGHFYYWVMGTLARLDYTPYLAVLQALHLVSVLVLWLLLRSLKFNPWPAALAALFFTCHMGLFDAYWKPMYVFDVLCGLFSLLCLLAYVRRRWVLSFLCLWLAYKSKELAVMLPVVLAWYEWRIGERNWRRLIPYFAVSLLFGVQALLIDPNPDADYRFHLSPQALATTVRFYSTRLGLAPYAGLALLTLPFLARDRRATWGIVAMVALLMPLLFLPGRLYGAYLYVPLIGAAIAIAGLASRSRTALVTVACLYLVWIPVNYAALRSNRSDCLAGATENRQYVTELARLQDRSPDLRVFLYDGLPDAMRPWGVKGALRVLFHDEVEMTSIEETNLAEKLGGKPVAMLTWDPRQHRLLAAARGKDASYIDVALSGPVWQLTSGWYPREGGFRWTRPKATAQLARPAEARAFEVAVNVADLQLATVGHPRLQVILDGVALEPREFTKSGWQTASWPIAAEERSLSRVELVTTPEYRPPGDSRVLGMAIGAFGFKTGIPR